MKHRQLACTSEFAVTSYSAEVAGMLLRVVDSAGALVQFVIDG